MAAVASAAPSTTSPAKTSAAPLADAKGWMAMGAAAASVEMSDTTFDGGISKSPLPYAFFTDLGHRDQNQDSMGVATPPDAPPVFAMVDGHAGRRAARYCGVALPLAGSERLRPLRKSGWLDVTSEEAAEVALAAAVSDVASGYRTLALTKNPQLQNCPLPVRYSDSPTPDWGDGACVIAATIVAQGNNIPSIRTAWAGDCLAFVVGQNSLQPAATTTTTTTKQTPVVKGNWRGQVLCQPHWPSVPAELSRLAALLNGSVVNDRLLGVLAVSRAIGDIPYHGMTWCDKVATCSYDLRPTDRFLVLMTDGVGEHLPWDRTGLWPVPLGVDIIWSQMQVPQRQADALAKLLAPATDAEDAKKRIFEICKPFCSASPANWANNDADNMSVLVVDLQPLTNKIIGPPPDTGKSPFFSQPLLLPPHSSNSPTLPSHPQYHPW